MFAPVLPMNPANEAYFSEKSIMIRSEIAPLFKLETAVPHSATSLL
ncbi:MAG: hypothetical protein H6655_10600 [Ardenticatenaceae bacterium]|nr:hypothetical protein [Ardenticatenaceae bacterium]